MPQSSAGMPKSNSAHFISRMLKSNRLPSLLGKSGNDPSVSGESTRFLSKDMWMSPTDLQTEEILRRVSAAQKKAVEAKCHKDRRDSKGFDARRRDLRTRNAANQLKASQLSLNIEPQIPLYQRLPAVSKSSSSSSLSSSLLS